MYIVCILFMKKYVILDNFFTKVQDAQISKNVEKMEKNGKNRYCKLVNRQYHNDFFTI